MGSAVSAVNASRTASVRAVRRARVLVDLAGMAMRRVGVQVREQVDRAAMSEVRAAMSEVRVARCARR
jgi:hypothetical protein